MSQNIIGNGVAAHFGDAHGLQDIIPAVFIELSGINMHPDGGDVRLHPLMRLQRFGKRLA